MVFIIFDGLEMACKTKTKMIDCQSINCNSCGAPVKPKQDAYGDCGYCGNTNKILPSGATRIVEHRHSNHKKPSTLMYVLVGSVALMLIPIIMAKHRKKF